MASPAAEAFDPTAIEKLRRIGGTDLVRGMVASFLESAPTRVAHARAAQIEGDRGGLAKALHSLLSSAGNLGGIELMHLCRAGQRTAVDGNSHELEELVDRVESGYERLAAHLRGLLEE